MGTFAPPSSSSSQMPLSTPSVSFGTHSPIKKAKKNKKKLTLKQRFSKILSGHKTPVIYVRELPTTPQSREDLSRRYSGVLEEVAIEKDVQVDDFTGSTMIRIFKKRLPAEHLQCMQAAIEELRRCLPSKHGISSFFFFFFMPFFLDLFLFFILYFCFLFFVFYFFYFFFIFINPIH